MTANFKSLISDKHLLAPLKPARIAIFAFTGTVNHGEQSSQQYTKAKRARVLVLLASYDSTGMNKNFEGCKAKIKTIVFLTQASRPLTRLDTFL